MKYEITPCIQCGTEFKRTNARHNYCSGACRVAAHRDRHGYEQPIFAYPSIRAVDAITQINVADLYLIKLYAMSYLDSQQKVGEPVPPLPQKQDMLRMEMQLRMASEEKDMDVLIKIVEPFTDLIHLVEAIKKDKN